MKRVDRALRESGIKLDIEIELDVQNLRKFFEEAAEEARLEAEKPQIMRDAVLARTNYVRKSGAQTDEGSLFAKKSPYASPRTSPLIQRKTTEGSQPVIDSELNKSNEQPTMEEPQSTQEPDNLSKETE